MTRWGAPVLVLALAWGGIAPAQDIPAPLSATVNDYADLLPPEAEARVAALLSQGRAETGVHVVVATITAQADYGAAGARIEDFAKVWFNTWGIGDPLRNDGVLILIARDDRAVRIALGAGYAPVWDGRAQRVIDQGILPAFRDGRPAEGIETGAALAVDQIARPFAAGTVVTFDSGLETPADNTRGNLGAVIFVLAAAGLVAFGLRRPLGDASLRLRRCPACGHRGLLRRREVADRPSQTATGRGIAITACPACGHEDRAPFVIPRQSRPPSDGDDGFGGGSSSGGGATGRW